MSKSTNTIKDKNSLVESDIQNCKLKIFYDQATFTLVNFTVLSKKYYLLHIAIKAHQISSFPELHNAQYEACYLVLSALNEDSLMYAVMDHLLTLSNRYVEENFTFKDYARFSLC